MTNEEFKLAVIDAKLVGRLFNHGRCAYHPGYEGEEHHLEIAPIIFELFSGGVYFVVCRYHVNMFRKHWKQITDIHD